MEITSRFATEDEIFNEEFQAINKTLLGIHREYGLIDHTDLNHERFGWYKNKGPSPAFYASRMWEYPFAILSAELEHGMKCADVGCGTTPFTPYLASIAGGSNVTGFDPDLLAPDSNQYYAFGVKDSFIKKTGINFKPDNLSAIHEPDESFDRVFCISVLEHIEQRDTWQKGIQEMARILKPGGRLILTVDLGIDLPLTKPMELILLSGLQPVNKFQMKWPEKRFLHINGQAMDVFGMVLEKSNRKINKDYNANGLITEYQANKKFIPEAVADSTLQIQKDLRRSFGMLRVISKLLVGKYKI